MKREEKRRKELLRVALLIKLSSIHHHHQLGLKSRSSTCKKIDSREIRKDSRKLLLRRFLESFNSKFYVINILFIDINSFMKKNSLLMVKLNKVWNIMREDLQKKKYFQKRIFERFKEGWIKTNEIIWNFSEDLICRLCVGLSLFSRLFVPCQEKETVRWRNISIIKSGCWCCWSI